MATFNVKLGYICGFSISRNVTTPASEIDVDPGECADDSDQYQIKSDATITVDITASGANGLDTGSESSSTWYYLWIIKNLTTGAVAGLISESDTDPTMPSGYTIKRRIGSVWNDGSADFRPFTMRGMQSERRIIYMDGISVLSGGNATSWTDIDCSEAIPNTVRIAIAQIMVREETTRCRFKFRENGVGGNGQRVGGYDQVEAFAEIMVDDGQLFEYKVDASSEAGYCKITGFREDL